VIGNLQTPINRVVDYGRNQLKIFWLFVEAEGTPLVNCSQQFKIICYMVLTEEGTPLIYCSQQWGKSSVWKMDEFPGAGCIFR